MLLFKKNYFYHLYIFFLALVLFFSEFSTNIVSSKNYNILDIKVEPTNPNHYCLPKESFEEYGFKIYDGTYEELHPNYNALLELK